jgi:hypothetical protein
MLFVLLRAAELDISGGSRRLVSPLLAIIQPY